MITRHMVIATLTTVAVLGMASSAFASPTCTTEPKSKWLSEAVMKQKITQAGYKDIKVFKVSGSCYEIYGYTKEGKRAEVYFNPVTAAVVERNVDGEEAGEKEHEKGEH